MYDQNTESKVNRKRKVNINISELISDDKEIGRSKVLLNTDNFKLIFFQ